MYVTNLKWLLIFIVKYIVIKRRSFAFVWRFTHSCDTRTIEQRGADGQKIWLPLRSRNPIGVAILQMSFALNLQSAFSHFAILFSHRCGSLEEKGVNQTAVGLWWYHTVWLEFLASLHSLFVILPPSVLLLTLLWSTRNQKLEQQWWLPNTYSSCPHKESDSNGVYFMSPKLDECPHPGEALKAIDLSVYYKLLATATTRKKKTCGLFSTWFLSDNSEALLGSKRKKKELKTRKLSPRVRCGLVVCDCQITYSRWQ